MLGIGSGHIKIHWGQVALPQAGVTNQEALMHMQNLQNITGTLLVFPGGFPQVVNAL
ncbi:MAG: hypothetical protein WCG98_09755 [bacterium]